MDNQIPNELSERRLKTGLDKYEIYPVYQFVVDDAPVELVLFLPKQRQIPLSPIDGKPMKRANLAEVEKLMKQM